MKLKSTYAQSYSLDRETKKLVVDVVLKQVEGRAKLRQNIYYGVATANGKEVQDKGLPYCVNAEYMAEHIALRIIEAWKVRALKEGKTFKLKHNKKKK